jgi:Ni,Fe-hydrogenase III large subunit
LIEPSIPAPAPDHSTGFGDVIREVFSSRTMVRIDEAREAARHVEAAAARAGGGPARAPLGRFPDNAHALGLVEAWRGPVWHWVLAAGPDRLARVKVADPSFRNWPALGAVVT